IGFWLVQGGGQLAEIDAGILQATAYLLPLFLAQPTRAQLHRIVAQLAQDVPGVVAILAIRESAQRAAIRTQLVDDLAPHDDRPSLARPYWRHRLIRLARVRAWRRGCIHLGRRDSDRRYRGLCAHCGWQSGSG